MKTKMANKLIDLINNIDQYGEQTGKPRYSLFSYLQETKTEQFGAGAHRRLPARDTAPSFNSKGKGGEKNGIKKSQKKYSG